ncbi:carbohydrate kinase family protein [Vallicoccus soli]|uniref:Carbohydrate kinase n=1 Tax=Vallicoccus soli TaxID=2339232 RepID=A0A3A3Z4U8_9ACTN|nr:carbohydrate kinase [Vallicoccus soli]RJK97978.1 carbohydrate kinase [Vallicoccus soli]
MTVTVVGEALVDLVRRTDGTEVAHPGGSPANVAVGLARLGCPVELVTRYADDAHGALVDAHLRGNGVRLGPGTTGAPATSVAAATLDADGTASYDFSLAWDLGDGTPGLADGTTCLHTGSIGATLEPGAAAVRRMVAAARGRATVSYDPNARPALMGAPERAREQVEALVAQSDVVKVSDEDLAWLRPGEPYDAVATGWLGLGPALVVVTRGADGPWAVAASGVVQRPAVRVDVVDTVGAGDAFMAGLLDGLHRRELLGPAAAERLRALDPEALTALLDEAALVAAMTVARPGADPPTREEVAARRAGGA